ncbi:hypothetical protein DH2020_040814 [Rehmannia glutinosa]|uniref:Ribulose bisphosphate carboxylase small subunit, chloroplastic n=1 Tax=Rehmannia glutinosa TaxID=99300 RepID=A0ABR0URW5_REHGL
MSVWPTVDLKKYKTLSYLPDITQEQLARKLTTFFAPNGFLALNSSLRCFFLTLIQIKLMSAFHGFVYHQNHASPVYYDGRYWTMWKLPIFGCTDSAQVLVELEEAKKAYPNGFIRIIGFDNVRQVQSISFITYKPPGF